MQDRLQRETNDKKNDLESYIYSLRNKLSDVLADYAPESMKASLLQTLNDMEVCTSWLCCASFVAASSFSELSRCYGDKAAPGRNSSVAELLSGLRDDHSEVLPNLPDVPSRWSVQPLHKLGLLLTALNPIAVFP